MFKDVIEYEDYNGDLRSQTVYFNLSKAEMIKMEVGIKGGYGAYLQQIAKSNDSAAMLNAFEEIVRKAYGIRSEDGTRFIKSSEITEEFMQTEAYSEFLMKLLQDSKYMAKFCNSIIPKVGNGAS